MKDRVDNTPVGRIVELEEDCERKAADECSSIGLIKHRTDQRRALD
ncbi:MAG: hypothetical protein R6V03_02350 [Kiritimatiellia bacterium]